MDSNTRAFRIYFIFIFNSYAVWRPILYHQMMKALIWLSAEQHQVDPFMAQCMWTRQQKTSMSELNRSDLHTSCSEICTDKMIT